MLESISKEEYSVRWMGGWMGGWMSGWMSGGGGGGGEKHAVK